MLGNFRVVEKEMETSIYIGIMEKKMEASILH